MDPENVNTRYSLGAGNVHLGKLEDAQSDFQKAAAMQPSGAELHHGSVLSLQGNEAEAVKMNQKAVSLNPLDYTFQANLASAYQWSGKQERPSKLTPGLSNSPKRRLGKRQRRQPAEFLADYTQPATCRTRVSR